MIRPPSNHRGVRTVETIAPHCPDCGGPLSRCLRSQQVDGVRVQRRRCQQCGLRVDVKVFGDAAKNWQTDGAAVSTIEQTASELGQSVSVIRETLRRLGLRPARLVGTELFRKADLKQAVWFLEQSQCEQPIASQRGLG